MQRKVEISHRTIIFTVLFLLSLFILYQIRQILVIFFVSLVLMSALNPAVSRLERMRIPRIAAILLVYLMVFLLLGLVIAGIIPPLIDQTAVLLSRLPDYFRTSGLSGINQDFLATQLGQIGSIPTNLLKITFSLFNNLLAVFILAVVVFYLLIERKKLDRYLLFLFGTDGEKKAKKFVDELEKKLGGWVRAQIFLMVLIGAMSYLGLRLLGIEFALPLALLAGLLEVIPNVGPTIASIPAILTGLAISPLMGLSVGALYFLIQQIENSFILPQVMSKGVGVNPLVSVMALATGFELAGVVGVVLSIPLVLLVQVLLSEFFALKHFKSL
ncbi:AI-2E family transporter [Patescibacteria group bacterium]